MFKNYLKTAFRNIFKHKLYSAINITGLTAGLTACLLISMFISHELGYDKFHTNKDRILRVEMEYGKNGEVNNTASTGTKAGPAFKRTFPAVEEYARTFISHGIIKYGEKAFDEQRILFADAPFFKIFSFHLLQGNPATVLDAPDKLVLTKTMAEKYFGNELAINKTITALGKEMIVSGICEDAPQNSQIKFDFVTPFLNLNSVEKETWWNANWITYLLVRNKKDIAQLQNQVAGYMKTPAVREEAGLEGNGYLTFHLQPLTRVHLHSKLPGFEPNGSMQYIWMFAVIALLILIIASANYTNLATAQSSGRGGEIGIRKVMGASKKQVFFQFIGESAFISFLSAVLAFLLAILLIPYFNEITGRQFTSSSLLQPAPVIFLLLFTVLISLLAGFYPALVLSGMKVIGVLRKGFRVSGSSAVLRRSLIVVQFCISVFLIIYTVIILQQIHFLKTKNLGYDKEHVVVLPIGGKMLVNFQNIKEGIAQVPGVESVTASYETPEDVGWSDGITATDEKGKHDISLKAMPVDLDFTKTMKMQLLAGRDFQPSDFTMMDTTDNYTNYKQPFIINESLVKKLGWTNEEALGKILEKGSPGPVVGVVKDFNFSSLREPIGPLAIFLGRDFSINYMARISGSDIAGTLGRLEMMWKQRIPDRPFSYHFLDEDYNKLYKSEQRSSVLFTVAAVLAILLACLGLFGLAAFTTIQRTKEIGIRRVLGADIPGITMLVAKNFLLLVGIAILIAVPAAWYAGNKWLQDFAFRIPVKGWVFLAAAVATILITLLTVSFHSVRAAMANPVKSLRSE